jgi:hypothetical protein
MRAKQGKHSGNEWFILGKNVRTMRGAGAFQRWDHKMRTKKWNREAFVDADL